MPISLRLPQSGFEKAFSERADLQAGMTVSVLFESPTGRQPAVVNVRLGGVNGNVYTIAVTACE